MAKKSVNFAPLVEKDIHHTPSNSNSPSIACALNKHEKNTVLQTLLEFSDVSEETFRYSDILTHGIDTSNSSPIRQCPRHFPHACGQETTSQIKGMLEQGVIQSSSSTWAFSFVLVTKDDGKFRFCVDYRKLYSVT